MDRDFFAADVERTAAALRSQLNQMAAASQVLEHSTTQEKDRAYLAVINQSICRMLRIVGRMELSHRLSLGSQLTLSPVDMNLSGWLEDLARRLEGIFADIGISFALRCPAPLAAQADPELLQQMLLELIAHVALQGNKITLTVSRHSGFLTFTVSDSGPGPAQDRPVLPAVLEDEEEKTSLKLARELAELHGGTLMTSTSADLGLSLAVSIPLITPDPFARLESPREPWNSGGFDPVLVALSELLPARSFRPENLG